MRSASVSGSRGECARAFHVTANDGTEVRLARYTPPKGKYDRKLAGIASDDPPSISRAYAPNEFSMVALFGHSN